MLFILNHKRGDIADIEHRFGLVVLLLSDDSLMAPDYRAERIGIANKAKPKKGVKKSPKQSKNGNLNDDKKQTSGNEGPDTNSTKTESSEVSFDEDSPKRRRRGRRGGRRRRRRNGEDSQNLDLSTQSNYGEPESFTQDDLPSEQRKTLKNNVTDKNGNQSKHKIQGAETVLL